jgi:hypothetical protein
VDLAKYYNGVQILENLVIHPHGGASRRSGTRYVSSVKTSSEKVRLIPFEFSTTQAYILEFGNGYIRIYKDEGQISVSDTDAAITNGTFDSDVSDWDDRSTGAASIGHDSTNNRLELRSANGETAWAEQDVTTTDTGQEHVIRFSVHRYKMDFQIGTSSKGSEVVQKLDIEPGYHSIAFTPSASPFYVQFKAGTSNIKVQIDDVSIIDNAPVEIGSPYSESDLAGLKFAQSADTMYLVHPDHHPMKLTRSGHTSWSLAEVDFVKGPFLDENAVGGEELTPSSTAGEVTITATSHSPFASTDVGRLVYIRDSGSWPSGGYAKIVEYNSATSVTAVAKENFQISSASTNWRLGAWSETTGWPASVAFYEERLFFGGNSDQPQTLWGSQTGDFENFTGPQDTADSDSLAFTIATDQVNAIRWLSPGRVLILGTAGGEFVMQASADAAITPTNVNIKRHTARGCANVMPVRIGHVVLYLQRAARKVREFVFDFQSDGFVAPDLTLLAEHISEGGIVEMAYAQEPDSVLWCIRADGVLLGMTYERDQDVMGWHRHILGGAFSSGQAVVESIAVIPAPNENHDQLWLVVKRTVNGVTKRYIEFMEEAFPSGGDQEDAFFVDSGLAYNGTATTVINGLDHLEAETVQVLADGAVHPNKTVLSGQITLDKAASIVHVGYGFVSRIQTMPLEVGSADGTAQGKTKRVHEAIIRFWNTVGAKVGPDMNTLDVIPFRGGSDAMGAPTTLFTGDKRVKFPAGYEKVAKVMVFQKQPLPMTVLAIMPRLITYDD